MFTGTLKVPRHEARRIVEELGGLAGASVNKSTDFLVVGEDQAGKSNKFITAGLLGVTRVDEDYFWEMVTEARQEEEDYSNLQGWITEETFFNVLNILEERMKHEVERDYPSIESMSYYSRENLERWLQSHEERPTLGKRVCPYCGEEIPYSISPTHWYCFRCKLFSDVGQETGRHFCVNYKRILETETGFLRKCEVCGNVEYEVLGEVDSIAKSDARCNYGHSLEFEAEVIQAYAGVPETVSPTVNLDSYERDKLYERFRASEERRLARFDKKLQLKQDKIENARMSK